MANIENANLVLRSADLPIYPGTKSIGKVNDANYTSSTWYNINLRSILGTMYDKYDKFNISLNSVSSGNGDDGLTTNPDDRNAIIYMSGLNFINNSYSVATGHNTGSCALGTIQFVPSGGPGVVGTSVTGTTTTQYFNGDNYNTFGKTCDNVNITIYFESVSTTDFINPWKFPECVYFFKIYGISN